MASETEAIVAIDQLLSALTDDERRRVLDWATKKFAPTLVPVPRQLAVPSLSGGVGATASPTPAVSTNANAKAQQILERYGDLASFFHALSPDTQTGMALVAGYWFQVVMGEQNLEAQAINDELKNLGHPIGNITRTLSDLKDQSPSLVMQTSKSGQSKQARKKYRLTAAGIREVELLLDAQAS